MSHRPLPVPSGGGGQQANGHPPKPLPRPGASPFNNRTGPAAPKTMPARSPSTGEEPSGRWNFHPIIDLPIPPAFKNVPKHYPSGGRSSAKVTAPSKPMPATPAKPGSKLAHQAPPPTMRSGGNPNGSTLGAQPKSSPGNPPPRPNAPPPKPSAGAPMRPGTGINKPAASAPAPAVNPSPSSGSSSIGKNPPVRPEGGPPPRPSTTPPKLPGRPAK